MKYSIKTDRIHDITIERVTNAADFFNITVDGEVHQIEIKETHPNGKIKTIAVDQRVIPVDVIKNADHSPKSVYLSGIPFDVAIEKVKSIPFSPTPSQRAVCGDIKSPLPGQIIEIFTKIGDTVVKGQPVVHLESMKMENEIVSPKDGVVKKILVSVGQMVMKDEVMIQVN